MGDTGKKIRDYLDENIDQPIFNAVSDYGIEPLYNYVLNPAQDLFTGEESPRMDLKYDDFKRGQQRIRDEGASIIPELAKDVASDPLAQLLAFRGAGTALKAGAATAKAGGGAAKALLGLAGKGADMLNPTGAALATTGILSAAQKLRNKKSGKAEATEGDVQGPGDMQGAPEMQGPDAGRPGIDRKLTRQDIIDRVQAGEPIQLRGDMLADDVGSGESGGGTFSRPASKEAMYEKILSAKERIEAQQAMGDAIKETAGLRTSVATQLRSAKTPEEQARVLNALGIDSTPFTVQETKTVDGKVVPGRGVKIDWQKPDQSGMSLSDHLEGYFHNYAKDRMGGYYNFPTGRSHSGEVRQQSAGEVASKEIARLSQEAAAAAGKGEDDGGMWETGGLLTALGTAGAALLFRKQIGSVLGKVFGKAAPVIASEIPAMAKGPVGKFVRGAANSGGVDVPAAALRESAKKAAATDARGIFRSMANKEAGAKTAEEIANTAGARESLKGLQRGVKESTARKTAEVAENASSAKDTLRAVQAEIKKRGLDKGKTLTEQQQLLKEMQDEIKRRAKK